MQQSCPFDETRYLLAMPSCAVSKAGIVCVGARVQRTVCGVSPWASRARTRQSACTADRDAKRCSAANTKAARREPLAA